MSMNPVRRILVGLVTLCAVGAAGALWRASRFRPPIPFGAPLRTGLPGDVGLRFTDVRLVGRSGGKRAWLLDAGRVDSARSRSRLELTSGIKATALENGNARATMVAPDALYEPLFHRVTASGGIVATPLENGKPQAIVKAPRATYALDRKTIQVDSSPTATIFENALPRATVSSRTLLYDLTPKRVTLGGNVEARLLPLTATDKQVTLNAPLAVWSAAEKSLVCAQGGTVTRGTFILEAASLSANLKTGIYTAVSGHASFELDEIKDVNPVIAMSAVRFTLLFAALGIPLAIALGGPLVAPPPKPVAPSVLKPLAQPSQSPKDQHPKSMDDTRVYPRADNTVWDSQSEQLAMTGRVIFEYKDSVFKSEKVLYNRPERVASAPVAVTLEDSQNTITGDRGTAYYKRTTTIIEGNVKIVARPDQPSKAGASTKSLRRDFDSPVTITSRSVTYNWKTRIAVPAEISRSLSQSKEKKAKRLDCHQRLHEYNGKNGNGCSNRECRARAKDGDKFDGKKAVVNLKDGANNSRSSKYKATSTMMSSKKTTREEDASARNRWER